MSGGIPSPGSGARADELLEGRLPSELAADEEPGGSSLLDLVDNLLDRGVVLHGELTLGLADVDLIYVRLSALLCGADRVLPKAPRAGRRRRTRGSRSKKRA